MEISQYIKNLQVPEGPVDVVLDTDTFNEIDDQFALSYLLKSGEKLNPKAFFAAPFFNHHSASPGDGMEKSYEEILRLLQLAGREELIPRVFKGSSSYLPDEKTPVISPAAEELIRLAASYTPERPLYVVAIGAITNVASALIMAPEIAEKIVIVWLGGNGREWNDSNEFNLMQDIAAGRVVFGSGAPVIQLPCSGVVSAFTVSIPELTAYFEGRNPLCDFLVKRVKDEVASYAAGICVSRVIWDVTSIGWLLNDGDRFMKMRLAEAPVPEYDGRMAYDKDRLAGYVYHIKRDALLTDLAMKLTDGKCF
ncbi:MAG: nucleoside hydrolase [Lachnospiraceae bacterium]|nr:nucleoside hydrolase [Lachnospiraceae bacterium]